MSRPVCIIVRDGYGNNPEPEGNAILAANTPNADRYRAEYPTTVLECCGEDVGLPAGYQGSSEVGHMNMGAGRIVLQELKRIDDGMSTGALFEKPIWQDLVTSWTTNASRLHVFGLLQDEGVHAHQEHLFKLVKRARADYPDGEIIVHPFLDGRDTPPRSTLEYIPKLKAVLEEVGNARIGTAMGRYYAMDRASGWPLTDQAYACIVDAQGRSAGDIEDAVNEAYANDTTPDGSPMGDEHIAPYVIGDYAGVQDGDVVVHTNYRQDRAIQLTRAFVDDDYPGTRARRPQVTYLGMSQYYSEFTNFLLGAGDGGDVNMDNLLGPWLAQHGKQQLRLSETEKFRHVTSFFNGKDTTPSAGEDQIEIKGRFDPATFADHPEMEAYGIVERLQAILAEQPDHYDFILINLANCDMVGHTGNFDSAVKATEIVDECLGTLVDELLKIDAHILIAADHGNSDQMVDYETGRTKTSHSMHPVECHYVASDAQGKQLIERGKLADLAPTALHLLGLPIPAEMTADVLLAGAPAVAGS